MIDAALAVNLVVARAAGEVVAGLAAVDHVVAAAAIDRDGLRVSRRRRSMSLPSVANAKASPGLGVTPSAW